MLEHMTEGSMSYVVHEYGCSRCFRLAVEDEAPFLLQLEDGTAHEVVGTYGMLKSGVTCTGINHRGKPQLVYPSKTLHEGVVDNIHQQPLGYLDKSEYRIVDNLAIIHLS